jgi:hypothetical protein
VVVGRQCGGILEYVCDFYFCCHSYLEFGLLLLELLILWRITFSLCIDVSNKVFVSVA